MNVDGDEEPHGGGRGGSGRGRGGGRRRGSGRAANRARGLRGGRGHSRGRAGGGVGVGSGAVPAQALPLNTKNTGRLRVFERPRPLIPAWTRNAVHVRKGPLDDVHQR